MTRRGRGDSPRGRGQLRRGGILNFTKTRLDPRGTLRAPAPTTNKIFDRAGAGAPTGTLPRTHTAYHADADHRHGGGEFRFLRLPGSVLGPGLPMPLGGARPGGCPDPIAIRGPPLGLLCLVALVASDIVTMHSRSGVLVPLCTCAGHGHGALVPERHGTCGLDLSVARW